MPFRTLATPRYGIISFDANGREIHNDRDGRMTVEILSDAQKSGATDIFLFSHGWMGDLDAAIGQYNRWIDAFHNDQANQARARRTFPGFKPYYIGLHWPSKPWGNEDTHSISFSDDDEDGPSPPTDFSESLGVTDSAHVDLAQLSGELEVKPGPDLDQPFSFKEGVLNALRYLSYFKMKKRARLIGEGGMHSFVRDLQTKLPEVRIHLMGHSFGTVVVSSILRGSDAAPPLPRPVDSVALIQGALSLWAFAPEIPFEGQGSGYFQRVIRPAIVRGPIITTRSCWDYAVGRLYPAASRVSGQVSFGDDEDSPPRYGAIGAYGIKGLPTGLAETQPMQLSDRPYGFKPGKIYNLIGDDFIKAHNDIAGPEVANALWQAALTK